VLLKHQLLPARTAEWTIDTSRIYGLPLPALKSSE